MTFDVIVAGGGPSGLIAARRIASDGHRVLVLEEHEQIGVPDHCAGLISTSGLQRLGLKPPKEVVQNTVAGARIFSPAGYSLTVERGQREALVVNRQEFDKWLAKSAQSVGVEIRTDSKVREILKQAEGFQIQFGSREHPQIEESRIIVVAEGSRGQLTKKISLPSVKKGSKLGAYQYEVSGVHLDTDFVEMFYGSQVSRGFFAWIIPLGNGRARVGIASKDHAKKRLQNAMKRHPEMATRLEGMRIERGFGGIVLVGLPVRRLAKGGAISLGDAAGIVKATTGGGVVVGGTMASLAGGYISQALKEQEDYIQLDGFECVWRSQLSRELQTMYYAQKLLTSLSDKGIDVIVKGAMQNNLLDIVKQEGDMDMQRKVILGLLKNPRMVLIGVNAIRYINPFL